MRIVTGVITIYFLSKKSTRNAYPLQTFPHEVGNLHGPVPFRRVYEDVGVAADADRVVAKFFKGISDDVFSEVTVSEVEFWVLLHSGSQFENSCLKLGIFQEEIPCVEAGFSLTLSITYRCPKAARALGGVYLGWGLRLNPGRTQGTFISRIQNCTLQKHLPSQVVAGSGTIIEINVT